MVGDKLSWAYQELLEKKFMIKNEEIKPFNPFIRKNSLPVY